MAKPKERRLTLPSVAIAVHGKSSADLQIAAGLFPVRDVQQDMCARCALVGESKPACVLRASHRRGEAVSPQSQANQLATIRAKAPAGKCQPIVGELRAVIGDSEPKRDMGGGLRGLG